MSYHKRQKVVSNDLDKENGIRAVFAALMPGIFFAIRILKKH